MRCCICDHNEWENVDKYRLKPEGMAICKNCGFISYPDRYKTEEEIKQFYISDYRDPPTYKNQLTGVNKLYIHNTFLSEVFQKWTDNGLKNPAVSDVGAAYGQFLDWVKKSFPDADVSGTEYALSYRRNAYHNFGIELDVDFDKSKKYDLISSFKVAEHQLDVDLRLREYVECLKDDGYMYISVPTWFRSMSNFGTAGFDIEYYYAPPHINVWTKKLFETLLKKVGLKIIKFDDWLYDETYLCKRDDSVMKDAPEYEKPDDIKVNLDRVAKAFEAFQKRQFAAAIEIFPNYPTAWRAYYESSRADAHKQGEMESWEYVKQHYIKASQKACPNSIDMLLFGIDLAMRYEKWQEAIDMIKLGNEVRPNYTAFIFNLSQCYRQMAIRSKDPQEQIALLVEARNATKYCSEIDMNLRADATTWMYKDNAQIPMPSELEVNNGTTKQ